MKYRVKLVIGWSGAQKQAFQKKLYLVQKKFWFIWITICEYETHDDAKIACDELNKING